LRRVAYGVAMALATVARRARKFRTVTRLPHVREQYACSLWR
jgi:hypothetical protein